MIELVVAIARRPGAICHTAAIAVRVVHEGGLRESSINPLCGTDEA
ncbi:MAG: hypothetical protein JO020_23630 [Chloroflexi bacterium]|nr:hypothetical protein [Chloroflexota bacterium]MBV9897167.1 hypothetical protein [Chloroflexota bacterium]